MEAITNASGFTAATSLGKYLGSMLHHGRGKRRNFASVLSRVKAHLSNWKSQFLSLAGRVTLANSVLSSIPIYHMQHGPLPISVCNEIEQIQRSFIWGDTAERKKVHLVSWDNLCKPRKIGGLGIHNLKVHNEAFLHKVAWGIISKKDSLWVQVLIGKYGRNLDLRRQINIQTHDSSLWKGVGSVWKEFLSNLQWDVGDGRNISFWHDRWTHHDRPLIDHALSGPNFIDSGLTVADMVDSNSGDWNFEYMQRMLPMDMIQAIQAILPPAREKGDDCLTWKNSVNIKNVVRMAYNRLMKFENIESDSTWNLIWNWKGPNRIRTFVWLVYHGRILTNEYTATWGGSPMCHDCINSVESISHALRDCGKARAVWQAWFLGEPPSSFFTVPLADWIRKNLTAYWPHLQSIQWKDIFITTIWFLWKWRNNEHHDPHFSRPENPTLVISIYIREIRSSMQNIDPIQGSSPARPRRNWTAPPHGWLKLNIDAAVQHDSSLAACGGLIRDEHGVWTSGFMYKIGQCPPLFAELWAMYVGIQVAWERKVSNLLVESDCLFAVQAVTGTNEDCYHHQLVKSIKSWCTKDWNVSFIHVNRESNSCADFLASRAFSARDPFVLLSAAPEELRPLLSSECC